MCGRRRLEAKVAASDVRFGSKADIQTPSSDVRFTPKSGHWNSVVECPLSAKSGHSKTARVLCRHAEMLLQEGDRTAPREFGGSLVVPAAGIVIEGVIDARIDVDDVTLVIGLKRRFKIRDPGINALIKPGIMQQQRCTDRWHLRRRDLQPLIDARGLD